MSRRRQPQARRPDAAGQQSDDTLLMLETAAKKPDEQLDLVLRFLGEELDAGKAAKWSGILKGLPLRPLASESGRLRIQWQMIGSYESLDVGTLKDLQANLHAGIRALVAPAPGDQWQGVWPLPRPEGLFMVREGNGWAWQYQHRDATKSEEGTVSRIVLAAAQLVAEHADRVRACGWCKTIFLAVKRQEYCTPQHAQLARDQKKKSGRGQGRGK